MRKLYTTTAVILLNCVLFSTFGLILLWGALEARHWISGRGQVVISDAIKFESFRLTPPDQARATAHEFDSYAASHPFVFNPWTTFMLAPVTGDYLNVVEGPVLNHRKTPSPNQDGSATPFTIWSFGGSTMYGFGVPDNQTLPAHLSRILHEDGRRVKVVNFGQPYWHSGVIAAAYGALLRSGYKPDMAIFLDGLNDMANLVVGRTAPYFSDQGQAAWERRRDDARRHLPWISINQSFPVSRVTRYVESRLPMTSPPASFGPYVRTKFLNSI